MILVAQDDRLDKAADMVTRSLIIPRVTRIVTLVTALDILYMSSHNTAFHFFRNLP